MKIRAHFRRSRRGRGRSLKLGRRAIQALSDEQFRLKLSQVPTGDDPAAWKQADRIRRELKQLRKTPTEDRPLIIRQGFRDSEVLDAVYPERKKKWLHSWQRSRLAQVNLTNFSFLDDPRGTMATLRAVAECEADCKAFSINFDDGQTSFSQG
jgi:hypothetical protein